MKTLIEVVMISTSLDLCQPVLEKLWLQLQTLLQSLYTKDKLIKASFIYWYIICFW